MCSQLTDLWCLSESISLLSRRADVIWHFYARGLFTSESVDPRLKHSFIFFASFINSAQKYHDRKKRLNFNLSSRLIHRTENLNGGTKWNHRSCCAALSPSRPFNAVLLYSNNTTIFNTTHVTSLAILGGEKKEKTHQKKSARTPRALRLGPRPCAAWHRIQPLSLRHINTYRPKKRWRRLITRGKQPQQTQLLFLWPAGEVIRSISRLVWDPACATKPEREVMGP